MNKLCKQCGLEFKKNKDEANHDWISRKFCRRECYLKFRTIGPKSKICIICKNEYFRIKEITNLQWIQSNCCGIPCRKIHLKNINTGFKKGHPVYSKKGRFKKGIIPWNKDKVLVNPFLKRRQRMYSLHVYKKWRISVFVKDKKTCIHCGIRKVPLQADHIIPWSYIVFKNNIRTVKQAKMCLELWDVSNGRTLCIPCHKKTPTYGKSLKRYIIEVGQLVN